MDIRNWPIDRIMQLPDCAFGRRWLIGGVENAATRVHTFLIIPAALPERMVIWQVSFWNTLIELAANHTRFALGDHLPTTEAEFLGMELLFKGFLGIASVVGRFDFLAYDHITFDLREPVQTAGRRIVADFYNGHAIAADPMAWTMTISSIPTEVPDWLISGPARSL